MKQGSLYIDALMLKQLDRYILGEMTASFLLGIFILMFILVTQQILRLMELVIDKGIDLLSVGGLFLRLLPSFFVMTIPMAAMMAAVTTFNRLSADNEIIALHSVGVGFSRLFRPVLCFSIVLSLLTLWMAFMTGSTQGSFKSFAVKMLLRRASVGLEEGQFNGIFSNMMIYVDSIPSSTELKGVFIYDHRNPESPTVIVAKEGVLISDQETQAIGLHLVDGTLHQNAEDSDRYQKMSFSSYDLKINLSELLQKGKKGDRSSYRELKQKVRDSKGEDMSALRHLSDFYKRFFFSLASLTFCIMGMPLGIISGRISRVGGFGAGIFVIAIYYVLTTVGDSLVKSGVASPLLAASLPILLLTPCMLFLLRRIATSASPTIFGIASKRP